MPRRSPGSVAWAGGLVAALVLAGCTSKADRIRSGLDKAAQYIQNGQWDKARVETRNVLQIDPKSAPAYALAARVAEGTGDYPRAWVAWQQSAELAPDDLDTQLAIARLRLLSGDNEGAERGIAQILSRDAHHAGARTLHAVMTARGGQVDAAIRQLRALVGGTPAPPPEAALMLASLLSQQGDRPGAVRVLDAALAATPTDVALLVAAAQVCEGAASDPALAARALEFHRRATQAAPRDPALWRSWAAFHVRRHEVDQAEGVLRAALDADPLGNPEPATLAWLTFLEEQRGAGAAAAAASAAVAAHPDTPSYRMRLAELCDADGQPAQAERTLRDLAARVPGSPAALAAQDRLARRALDAGDVDEARSWLAKTLATQPRDAQALRLRAGLALARGEPAAAVVDLRAALHDAPGSAELAGMLAQAHRANGEPQLARDVLADAVRLRPDDPALHLLLAADMADAGEVGAANDELDTAIAQAPRDARAYAAKARLALARRDIEAAERIWRARLAATPDDADAWLDVAAMRLLRHDPRGALAVFDAGERQAPDRLAIPLARAEWLARQGDANAAITAYERLAVRAPHDPAVANNLAWLLAQRRGDPASLGRALALALPLAATGEPRYLDTLGWVQLRLGRPTDATATLERAARLAPRLALVQLHLGLALQAGGDSARAEAALHQAQAGGVTPLDVDQARRLLAAKG